MKNEEFITYQLNEEEIKVFLSADYGINSKSGNKSVGKTIIQTIYSFQIKKERKCFYAQRVKDLAIKKLSSNNKVGSAVKLGLSSNYVHQMMMYEIKMFLYRKNNPQLLELK